MRTFTSQLTRTLMLIGVLLTTCISAFGQQKPESSPWQRPESSMVFFESLGLKLDKVKDRTEQSDKGLELYLRVLMRMKQLPAGLVFDWTKDAPDLNQISSEPSKYRGELLRYKGFLRQVTRYELPTELAERFDIPEIYRLQIGDQQLLYPEQESQRDLADGPSCIDVWTTAVPPTLFKRAQKVGLVGGDHQLFSPGMPIEANAIFLSVGQNEKRNWGLSEEPLNFVADRVKWLQDFGSERSNLEISDSHAALGRANFDIGLLDTIKSETSKRLTAELTEPFHQMLAAQSRVDWSSLNAAPLELGKLISSPNDFVGEAIEFDAVARRVVEIPIENESDRKRLQLDRYFQVDLIIPKPIRTLVKDKAGIEHEVQQENFPLTLCTTEPPPGLTIGEDIREPIRAKAFFFKLWAYESKFAKAQSADTMQVSPLFISATLERVPPPELATSSLIWLVCGATGILAAIALWGYLLIRSDDQHERRLKTTQQNEPTLTIIGSDQ